MRRGANAGASCRDRAGFAPFGAVAPRADVTRRFASSQHHTAIGQVFPQVDGAERLRLTEQPIHQKVHRRRLRKEPHVRDRVPRQIAAGSEARNAGRRDACVGSVDAPSAFRRHNEIVRRAEELIDTRVHEAAQRVTRRLIVGHQRRVRIFRRSGWHLNVGDQLAVAVHRMETRQIA